MIKKITSLFAKKSIGSFIGTAQSIFGYWSRKSYRNNFTYANFYSLCDETYNSSPDMQEAIDKIAKECSNLPLCYMDCMTKETQNEFKPSLELNNFLYSPLTSGLGFTEFVRQCLVTYFVSGEIILLKVQGDIEEDVSLGRPLDSISVVKPNHLIKAVRNKGVIMEYQLSGLFFSELNSLKMNPNSNVKAQGIQSYHAEFLNGTPVSKIAYMLKENLVVRGRGLGIVATLLNDINILKTGREWNRSLLENEGRPSGVFFYPPNAAGALNQGQMVGQGKRVTQGTLDEQVRKDYSSSKNAGKALILKGGLQYKETSYNMKDSDFIQGLKLSRGMLASAFGIPAELFGSQESSTFNNKREAREYFISDTCVPLMNQFLEFFSRQVLAPHYSEMQNKVLKVDTTKLEVSVKKRAEQMKALDEIDFLTINEKREKLQLKPIKSPNANTIMIQGSMKSIDDLGMDDTLEQDFEDIEDIETDDDKDKDKEDK